MRRWLLLGAALGVLGIGAVVLVRTPAPPALPYPAPDFLLPDTTGQAVRLSQLKGKVVFLNVWATWCGPCRQEMPTMQALADALDGEDFVLLAASQDVDGAAVVRPYLEEGGYRFPVLLDVRGEVGEKYGVTGYPESFVIDRQGRVVYHHVGYGDWSQPRVEAAMRRLITRGEWDLTASARGLHTPLRPE